MSSRRNSRSNVGLRGKDNKVLCQVHRLLANRVIIRDAGLYHINNNCGSIRYRIDGESDLERRLDSATNEFAGITDYLAV